MTISNPPILHQLFPLDAFAATILEVELLKNTAVLSGGPGSLGQLYKKLDDSPVFKAAFKYPRSVPAPILTRFQIVAILYFVKNASTVAAFERIETLNEAFYLLQCIDMSPSLEYSDATLDVYIEFKTQMYISLHPTCHPSPPMKLNQLMAAFEENTLSFMHDVSITEHESLLKRWKYKVNLRKNALRDCTRNHHDLESTFPYSILLGKVKSVLSLIAANVNQAHPPTAVMKKAREDAKKANDTQVAPPPVALPLPSRPARSTTSTKRPRILAPSVSPSSPRSPFKYQIPYDEFENESEEEEIDELEEDEIEEEEEDEDEVQVTRPTQQTQRPSGQPDRTIRYFTGDEEHFKKMKTQTLLSNRAPRIHSNPPVASSSHTTTRNTATAGPSNDRSSTESILKTIGKDLDKGIILLGCYKKESDDLEASIKALVDKRNNLRDRMDRIQKHIANITTPKK